MQTLSVAEKGIAYLGLALRMYSEGCAYFALYVAALLFVLLKGSDDEKRIFLPPAFLMLLTIFNPVFPMVLNRFFDVNNEYYRFFWIAPVVILVSYICANLAGGLKGYVRTFSVIVICIVLALSGQFLYKSGFIKTGNLYKMPDEIPQICQMIHDDSAGRYDGDYYPRAVCEFDYEMCLRQYDASIMLVATREAYLDVVQQKVSLTDALDSENFCDRVILAVANNVLMAPSEFTKGLDKTGTEYVCVSTVRADMCSFLENDCGLRLVGRTANHSLYHFELQESEGWRLPDYSDVWENY